MLGALMEHPEPTVRLAALQRCGQLPVADTEQVLLPRLLAALGSTVTAESAAAAGAVFATYAGEDPKAVEVAVARIARNRRAVQTVIGVLRDRLKGSRGQLMAAARAVLAALEGDPLTVNLRVALAVD